MRISGRYSLTVSDGDLALRNWDKETAVSVHDAGTTGRPMLG